MLQLPLNFLNHQIARFRPETSSPVKPKEVWIWKHGITVHLVRQPRARRYLLRVQPDGTARLVLPRRGSQAEGVRFLERNEAWLLQRFIQWKDRNQARPSWTDGTCFLFRGEEVVLRVEGTDDNLKLHFSNQTLPIPHALANYRAAVLGHLRGLAERELPVRTRELARVHDIAIHRISVRAQKTRWGSCSARGTISLNWRLIQAPPAVMDYLIIHELMHRREMNHSTRYWKLVAQAFPDYRAAEQWLKQTRLELLS